MKFEEYDIVKLYSLSDDKVVYVAILNIKNDIYKVKLLKQPSYSLINNKYSDNLFHQFCHQDDEVHNQLLNLNKDECTFEVQ